MKFSIEKMKVLTLLTLCTCLDRRIIQSKLVKAGRSCQFRLVSFRHTIQKVCLSPHIWLVFHCAGLDNIAPTFPFTVLAAYAETILHVTSRLCIAVSHKEDIKVFTEMSIGWPNFF